MKKILLACLILMGTNAINAQSYTKTVKENNRFSFELFREVFEADANSFISPYSISSALAMTYAGARGNTEKQMADVLHFNLNQLKTHKGFSSLNSYFEKYNSDTSTKLSIANAIWKKENLSVKQEFLDLTKKYYQASIYPLNSAKEINAWVNKETRNKIPTIVSEPDVAGAEMVLTNAIYFKGSWLHRFNKENTKLADFNGRQVNMMYQKNTFKYFSDDDNQIIELPYQDENISMVVILPKTENNIADVVNELDYSTYEYYLDGLRNAEVHVHLPLFKVEGEYGLNDPLISMGMVDAFKSTADFTGMSGGLYISKIIHKTFVEVNEEGTEAAAATAVIMRKSMSKPRTIEFKADRPFIFLLKDNETNSILFIGAIAKPKE